NVENLTGGAGTDIFAIKAGQKIAGKFDGGGGSNTLDFSDFTTAVSVNLQTRMATAMTGFANIENFLAGTNPSNILSAANLSNPWTISGANAGSITDSAGTSTFTGFGNLNGGSLDDTLTLGGNPITGKIHGIETINP